MTWLVFWAEWISQPLRSDETFPKTLGFRKRTIASLEKAELSSWTHPMNWGRWVEVSSRTLTLVWKPAVYLKKPCPNLDAAAVPVAARKCRFLQPPSVSYTNTERTLRLPRVREFDILRAALERIQSTKHALCRRFSSRCHCFRVTRSISGQQHQEGPRFNSRLDQEPLCDPYALSEGHHRLWILLKKSPKKNTYF